MLQRLRKELCGACSPSLSVIIKNGTPEQLGRGFWGIEMMGRNGRLSAQNGAIRDASFSLAPPTDGFVSAPYRSEACS
jgi:hypothetical protein